MQQKFDGSMFFNQSWTEMKGFGDVDGNFWMGNEYLHQLTMNGTYKRRVDLQAAADNKWYWAVDAETAKYKLHIANYTGNAGDASQPEARRTI